MIGVLIYVILPMMAVAGLFCLVISQLDKVLRRRSAARQRRNSVADGAMVGSTFDPIIYGGNGYDSGYDSSSYDSSSSCDSGGGGGYDGGGYSGGCDSGF